MYSEPNYVNNNIIKEFWAISNKIVILCILKYKIILLLCFRISFNDDEFPH